MGSERTSIKIFSAALDEQENEIVMRGVIDPTSLANLEVADYQREILPNSKINSLMSAIQKGGVPDIQLGCRGGNYRNGGDGVFYIQDAVYIIDGLQRRTAAIRLMDKGIVPHLGCVVSFNTNEEMERERFRVLNVTRVKLSPNVLLRNARHDSQVVSALYQLCLSSQFVLQRRVCWHQRMKREELVTASVLLKMMGELHRRFGASMSSKRQDILIPALDRLATRVGRGVVIGNIREFWDVLADAFKIQEVVYTETAPMLRQGFLLTLAKVFASHEDFWQDAEFRVPKDLRRKLSMFAINDPHVASMCGASGSAMNILAAMLVDHFNSGKRTRRLRPFNITREQMEEETAEEELAHA